jgi:hypothetical protein
MAVIDKLMWVEEDVQFNLAFFYCRLCPLTIPFLEVVNAQAYQDGHRHNSYHKRRLELLG